MDALTILGIILSVSSITLSIVAIWFSWISYKNSTDLQMKAQSILEQISQKVEVIVDKTSHQIDRAWDYFTKAETNNENKEVVNFNFDKLRKDIIEETKSETFKIIGEAGLDKEKIKLLEKKVEAVVNKTTDRTQEAFNKQLILDKYSQVENDLRLWLQKKLGWIFPPNIMLMTIINSNKEISDILPETLRFKLRELTDVRNKIAHSKEVDKDELNDAIYIANDLINFFHFQ